MSRLRSSVILVTALVLTAGGCGAIPDALKADLKETAQTAVEDTAKELIQDVADYVLQEVLDTELDFPLDLNSNGIDLPSASPTEVNLEE